MPSLGSAAQSLSVCRHRLKRIGSGWVAACHSSKLFFPLAGQLTTPLFLLSVALLRKYFVNLAHHPRRPVGLHGCLFPAPARPSQRINRPLVSRALDAFARLAGKL